MNFVGWKISNRGIGQCFLTRLHSSLTTTTTSDNNIIKLPLRKERGPTDVLNALEKTLKRDPTAPKYKYHDDPYLIPYSNAQKRGYALSQESGRKTAMWIRKTHADLFKHRIADPIIEEFLPKAIYDNKDNVSEDILINVIANGHSIDALNIYKLLDENTSIQTKQALFELLCYYNNNNNDNDNNEIYNQHLFEEKWFRQSDKNLTWKNCPDIEKLFTFLTKQQNENKEISNKAYNTMICATAKYLKAERAFDLFNEALDAKIPISITTFNSIIEIITLLREGNRERRQLLIEILDKIKSKNVEPNTATLNCSLKIASLLNNNNAARDLARSLLTEFNIIGVEPSLASFNYILRIFYRNDAITTTLDEILNYLENKKLTIKDKKDIFFFSTAMNIATNNHQDCALGDRIHKLLLTDDNYNFIGDGLKENIYYRNYLMLQIKNKKLDVFVKDYYDLLVPHVYTPEPSVMDEILNTISANDPEISRQLLPRFWTHIVQFDQLERKNLITKALNLMKTHCKPPKNSILNETFGEAGWTVWNYVNTQMTKRMQTINWSGPILGDIAVLCLRAGKYERWSSIISYLLSHQNSIIGTPDMSQINELFDECILSCHTTPAIDLVNYCADVGFEDTNSMAYKVYRNLPLISHEESRLKSIVGPEVLKVETTK